MLNKINSKKEPYSDMVESATPKPKSEYVAQNYIPSRLFVDNWIPSEYSKLTSLRAINDNTLKEQKVIYYLTKIILRLLEALRSYHSKMDRRRQNH